MRRVMLAVVLVSVLALAGCTAGTTETTGPQGEFELLVSDAPAAIGDFDSLDVTFSEARVFRDAAGNKTDNETEVQQLPLDRTVDLTRVVGVRAVSLLNTTLPAGNYTKIELVASDIDSVVDGSQVEVMIPPGKLMLTKPFTIGPNSTTRFVFDIQVVLRGSPQNNQGYLLQPVISQSGIANEDVRMRRAGPPEDAGMPDDAGPEGEGPQ